MLWQNKPAALAVAALRIPKAPAPADVLAAVARIVDRYLWLSAQNTARQDSATAYQANLGN